MSPEIASSLLRWYSREMTSLPWRDDPRPYRVWVGEVMSQQTTLGVAVPRFERFVREIPDVATLASCPEARLRRLWSGLGYYARARSLRLGAQVVIRDMKGRLPTSRDGWLAIPGCGPCTSAMLASICHDEHVPAVDGNVVRVWTRLTSTTADPRTAAVRNRMQADLASRIRRVKKPGDFNQALMQLGQQICTRSLPACSSCPLETHCEALAAGTVDRCPAPRPRRASVPLSVTVLVVRDLTRNALLVGERTTGLLRLTTGFALQIAGSEVDTRLPISRLLGRPFSHSITRYRIDARAGLVDLPSRHPRSSTLIGRSLGLRSASWVPVHLARAAVASALDIKALDALSAFFSSAMGH